MTSQPPAARRVPAERTHHGDTFIDDYAWLAVKDDPETIAFLEAENAFTAELTAGQQDLRAEIFEEIKARTKETDLSVPVRKGGWWYYVRTVEGKQYAVQCRRAVRSGETTPPVSEDGAPLPGEEVLLDGNELAGDSEFFSIGAFDVSPDGALLAYSTDMSGDERFTLRVKDLQTGELEPDEIPDTFYGSAWAADGSALFYVTVDEAWRPYRIWRHMVGTPASQDVIVYQEDDGKFGVGVGLSRSERYLMISSSSKLTSEVRLLDAGNPAGEFTVVAPRRPGVEYDVEHQAAAGRHRAAADPAQRRRAELRAGSGHGGQAGRWTPLIAHRDDTRLLGVDAFAGHLVVYLRKDGLTGLRVLGSERPGARDRLPGADLPGSARRQPRVRDRPASGSPTVSLVTPGSVYDCDVAPAT